MDALVRPLVGLPADTHENGGFLYHSIGDKYVRAVAEVAQCVPVMIQIARLLRCGCANHACAVAHLSIMPISTQRIA